jgi:8-oxo-dGTP pyrophosphatase MutT (NUDIX family)
MNTRISLEHANKNYLFYVAANAAIVNPISRSCLIIERAMQEIESPGLWAFPGGRSEHKIIEEFELDRIENILQIIACKELFEETGLVFDASKGEVITNGLFVRKDKIPVIYATVAATYQTGIVVPETNEVSNYAWATEHDLQTNTYNFVGNVAQEGLKAIRAICG